MSIEPKRTIYLNNLNDKVSINKLRSNLATLLQPYNPTNIVVAKTLRLKGQAFITFQDVTNAQAAINQLNNKQLFSKSMRASFAHLENDAVLSPKEQQEQYSRRYTGKIERNKVAKLSRGKPGNQRASSKTRKGDAVVEGQREKNNIDVSMWKNLPPNHILLLQNISSTQVSKETIEALFTNFEGFENTRFVKVRNLAFIEFENEEFAKQCLDAMDDTVLKEKFGNDIIFSYAKK